MENENTLIETKENDVPDGGTWVPRLDASVDENIGQFEGYRPTNAEEEESAYRLSLTVIKGKKPLANAYYNWSGFTETGADYAYNMTKYRRMLLYPKPSDMLFVMRMLSLTGAGMKPSTPIEFTQEGMKLNDELANYHMTVNYDKRFVDFSELFEEIEEKDLMANGWLISDAVDWPSDLGEFDHIKFAKIPAFRKFVAYLAMNEKIIRKDGKLFHSIY